MGVARLAVAVALVPLMTVQPSLAWGADGHRMINRLAAANLPADVPAFLRNGGALDAMDYLGPEPMRSRAVQPATPRTVIKKRFL